mmetsp:Transcript_99316/g.276390  ORF Transcript_99316/g.276390 Transcript_99316/m.276390 type:complete len:206 (-) Transcript_99316:392-1009(-)
MDYLREHGFHILDSQHFQGGGISADSAIKHKALLLLKLQNTLFDSTFCNETDCSNWTILSKAMSAVDGLHFSSRVPPWVHQIGLVGNGQIQGNTTGLERHEKNTNCMIFSKILQGFVPRLYVHATMDNSHPKTKVMQARVRMQSPADEIKHIHELRENQSLATWPLLPHLNELLDQSFHFRRGGKFSQIDSAKNRTARNMCHILQ